VGEILNSKQRFVKAEVSQRLDELLSMGVAKSDQKTETKLYHAKTKLVDLEVKINAILGFARIAIPNAEAEAVAATVRSSLTPRQDMKDQKDQRDELLSHFGGMVKERVTCKMEELTEMLSEVLNELMSNLWQSVDKDRQREEGTRPGTLRYI
jgi:hypothetical protein